MKRLHPQLSRLGFGVSGVHGTPLIRRADTAALIVRAAELGVRVFDTAPSYGDGEAERRLGMALKSLDRSETFVSTKAGVTGSALSGRERDFSPDAIEASLRGSLERLGLEGVDGLFLHGVGHRELTRPLLRRLGELRKAGAFRRLGAAGRGADLDAVLATGRFKLMMTPVHPWISEAARARIASAQEAGVRVIAIETAGPGAPPVRPPRRVSDLHGLVRALRARSGDEDAGARLPAAQALAGALADRNVRTVLFTTSRMAHLEANAALASAR